LKKIYKAPAKINLGLHVLRKRSDGFHDISTAMLAVDWNDELSIEPADEVSFSLSGSGMGIDLEKNLCTQAAQLVLDKYENAKPVSIHLDKQIPVGAGLGGGSSNAASVLIGMNEIWDLGASVEELKKLASELGSDVAFFVEGLPALAGGRGEVLSDLDVPCKGTGEFEICICMPRDVFISTEEAYSKLTPSAAGRPEIALIVKRKPMYWWPDLENDFEASIEERHSIIIEIKNWMQGCGAEYTSMTGSGAAVFGIFEKGRTEEVRKGLDKYSDQYHICPF